MSNLNKYLKLINEDDDYDDDYETLQREAEDQSYARAGEKLLAKLKKEFAKPIYKIPIAQVKFDEPVTSDWIDFKINNIDFEVTHSSTAGDEYPDRVTVNKKSTEYKTVADVAKIVSKVIRSK